MEWNLDLTLDIAAILTLITIIIIVINNYRQYKQMKEQLKIQNEQLKAQNEQTKHNFFADYTKRYQDIILNFPENINEDDFKLKKLKSDAYEQTMRYMRVYFDLCSEEYFLYKKKFLDKDVWREWKEGMEVAFNKPAFNQAWKIVTEKSIFYKDFQNFVNNDLLKSIKTKK